MTKQLPALPFASHVPKSSASSKVASKIHMHTSPFEEALNATNSALADPELNTLVDSRQRQLKRVLKMTTELGSKSTLPARGNLVPILNLSNVRDSSLQFFHSIFVDSDEQTLLSRDEMLNNLSNFIPYVTVEQCDAKIPVQRSCSNCSHRFNFFNKPNSICYRCKLQFCKTCPINQAVFVPRLQLTASEQLCSKCLQHLRQLDVDDWTKFSVDLIKVGTLGSVKAAMGCLTIALCLSDSSTKPVMKVAQGFFHHGLPELAMPFVSTVLQNSKDSREILGMYVLGAQIFKTLADQTKKDTELQWNFLLGAKDCCNLAMQEISTMESSIEVPNLTTVNREITDSLHLIREKQEHMQEVEIQLQCVQMEVLWQKRDYENLLQLILPSDEQGTDKTTTLSFLPRLDSIDVIVLEHFLAPKNGFLDRMCPDDRCALIFFRGILKIRKERFSDGLADIEEAAYHSHHHQWLKEAVANFLIGLMIDNPASLFPPDSYKKAFTGKRLLNNDSFDDRFESIFPQKHEIMPPFNRNWPELTVMGMNTRGHVKFEKAVISQVNKGEWKEWDVAMAYIDYVPACGHPAELALCFLNAAMWLLKHLVKILSSSSKVKRSEIYATKSLIMNFLQNSLTMAYLRLHPGMQLYISRLCLGTVMETMQHAKNYATQTDVDLATSLLHLMIYTCRFCPIWRFPSVPLSEAVLMNIKTGRFHQDFLLDLQDIDQKKWPITRPELLYQLYENDLRYICPLEDSDGARARAMEEMLHEKGWTWENVADIMTSPLSPRDPEGFLIQRPIFGVSLQFSELKGFAFNLDTDAPSIEILAIPADASRGRLGLFSMEDVQTVLQLELNDLIFFSLDPPNENQRFHPFQQFRYGNEKLHKTSWLHTLFETDYLLKSFSVGAEVSAKPPFNQRPCEKGLTKNLPPHLQEAIKPVSKRGNTISNIHRFWIQAGELVYEQKQVGSKLTFHLSNLKMSVRSHPLIPGPDGKLEDTDDKTDPDSPEAKFAADLTAHYNELGLHFPMFGRLRELAKLQMLGAVVRSVMEDMRGKANGVGVEVPRRLLTEIQQDARERQQTQIREVIRNLDQEVGVWPAADDYNEVYSLTQKLIGELPYHIRSQASYSDVKPYAEQALQTKDNSVLSQVVDALMQLCDRRLSRSRLESSVRHWLSTRSSSAAENLKDLVCSALPLPTNADIKRQLVEVHSQRYRAFQQKVNSVTSPLPRVIQNPCKWVPAALLKEETSDSLSMCYGGVLLLVDFHSGSVRASSHAKSIPVQRCGTLGGQHRSSMDYHTSFARATASDGGNRNRTPIKVNCSSSTANSSRPKTTSRPANKLSSTLRFDNPTTNSRGQSTSSSLNSAALVTKALGKDASNSKAHSIITNNASSSNQKSGDSNKGKGSSGKNGGSGNGNGGDGGDGSGDDGQGGRKGQLPKEEFVRRRQERWEEVKRNSKVKYTNGLHHAARREYYVIPNPSNPNEKIVVSQDKAGHAQAIFKAYKIKKKTFEFIGSLNVDMKLIASKHESRESTSIKISDLIKQINPKGKT